MPGVPSSRGCDACRRQKKKCDESKPACGRCSRLGIECNGAGQQRYKFQIDTKPHAPRRRSPKESSQRPGIESSAGDRMPPSAPTTIPSQQQQPEEGQYGQGQSWRQITTPLSRPGLFILTTPSGNAQTAITGRLVSALKVTDPRFDLSIYGSFLRDIPRRVGCSPVLDAAVSALTVTFPLAMAVPPTDPALVSAARPTVEMLHHYGHALKALRAGLCSRDSISAPDTLCALYLIVVLQGWLQQDEGSFPSHGEAISTILTAMKYHQTGWGDFELGIVKTLSFLVVMESFINPRIELDKHLRRMTESEPLPAAAPHPQAISCLDNNSLVDISMFLRCPRSHYHSLVEAYDRVRADRAKFAALIASIPVVPTADGRLLRPLSLEHAYVHIRYQTGYATLTLLAIRIAAVLAQVPRPVGREDGERVLNLDIDLSIYVNDLATVAEQAIQYYPLGSSFMPTCLLAAYATQTSLGDDLQQQLRIVRLFTRYRPGVDLEREWLKIQEASGQKIACDSRAQSSEKESCDRGGIDVIVTKADMCCIL